MKREIEFLPIKTFVFDTPEEALESAAREMANWIRTRKYQRGDACLGLSTGDVLETFYEKMKEMSGVEDKGGLPISGLRPVTLGEIAGCGPQDAGSLHKWLVDELLEEWGTQAERRIYLDGSGDGSAWDAACAAFEEKLKANQMDLCLVGLTKSGGVGWNEPGVDANSRTRVIETSEVARAEFVGAHADLAAPTKVLAPGIATLRGAKRVRIYAFGAERASAVEQAMLPDPDARFPLSLFVGHKDVELMLDSEAASALE